MQHFSLRKWKKIVEKKEKFVFLKMSSFDL